MELSERCIQTLEKEGFPFVYEWKDKPGMEYSEQTPQHKVSVCVTEGVLFVVRAGISHEYVAGSRCDLLPGIPYLITVGPTGCQYVIGEMNDGDHKVR